MQRLAVASLVLLATLSCALFAATPTRAQGTEPLALVSSFYAPDYRNDRMPLSQRLGALLDAAIANSRKIDAPVSGLDFAWQLNAQDSEPGFEKTLTLAETARDAQTATVRASFRNGRDEELEYRLLRENGIWTIDDILYLKGDQTSLSQMLIDGANEKP